MKKIRKGSGRTEWLPLRLDAKLVREWNPFVDRAVSEGVFGSDQITPRLRVEEAIRLAIAFCSGFYEREMQRRVWARIDRRVRYHVAEEVLRALDLVGRRGVVEVSGNGGISVTIEDEGGALKLDLESMNRPETTLEQARELWASSRERVC